MQNWMKIDGWFSPIDTGVNSIIAKNCRPGGTIVVVGVYHGRSTAQLCEELRTLGKVDVRIVCVDIYPDDMLEKAKANLENWHNIEFVKSRSVEASKAFPDGSIDAVFIDATHNQSGVEADVKAWLRKVRAGGIISGHDYCSTYSGVMEVVNRRFAGQFALTGSSWSVTLPVSLSPLKGRISDEKEQRT